MADNNTLRKDLGPVTAYAIAVEAGFEGTQEEWVRRISSSVDQQSFNTLAESVASGDATLSAKIDTDIGTEAAARSAADTAEAVARSAADTAEATARETADTAQSGRIDALSETVAGNDATLRNILVHKPADSYSPDGSNGQVLMTHGDGTTEWSSFGQPTPEQAAAAVSAWLDAHPEATTTVVDGSITKAKLDSELKDRVNLATNSLAPIFQQATANDPGTYVSIADRLYYLPEGHTADVTWENTTKVEVQTTSEIKNLSDDVTGLKSAIQTTGEVLFPVNIKSIFSLQAGGVVASTGATAASSQNATRARTAFLPINKPTKIRFNNDIYAFVIWTYSTNSSDAGIRSLTNKSYIVNTNDIIIVPEENEKYFRIAWNKSNQELTTDLSDPTSDWSIISNSISINENTDSTLTKNGIPADGMATGNAVKILELALNRNVYAAELANGTPPSASNQYAVRSTTSIPFSPGETATISTDRPADTNCIYRYGFHCVDANGNLLTADRRQYGENGSESNEYTSVNQGTKGLYIAITQYNTVTNEFVSLRIADFNSYNVVVTIANANVENTNQLIDYDNVVKSIAHRGYSAVAPENTMPAFKMARENGFNIVETDIHFTADNVPVCIHDSTIDRTSNGTGAVNSMTLNELLTYDFGSWKNASYAGTKIPTFEEFISFCRNTGLIPYIELKTEAEYTSTQLTLLVAIAKKYGIINRTVWISKSIGYLGAIKQLVPNATLGYVTSLISSTNVSEIKEYKTDNNYVFINVNYENLTSETIQIAVDNDIPLEVWTVGNNEIIINLNPYITGIISNSRISGKIIYDNAMQ